MFYHVKELQFQAKPDRPDPVFAKKLQEILGGQFGEMTVAMQYLFQGWNCRCPTKSKYRDLLLDTGTEELAQVEMIATMIARLLDQAPVKEQEEAAKHPVIEAVMGGMNPQHVIVSGLGATPTDSVGYPWNARYTIASGNLLADFRANLHAESQGRLQAVRLWEMADDQGVKEMLAWLIARDNMHQNQWLAAIKELEECEGDPIVPITFPRREQVDEVAYTLFNFSKGNESARGSWAHGLAPDQCGKFQYDSRPVPYGEKPCLPPAPKAVHNTPPSCTK